MKAKLIGLIAFTAIASALQTVAGQRIQVEAVNNDISYYLDLKAVASVFGDSRDLEDFEYRINDYDSQISNLDLNNDGVIDYLRVIETSERNTHLVVIQAVLERDVYQDVATIVVERNRNRKAYVQVIGDPYIYGANYIIDPYYYSTPRIVNWFWSGYYSSWVSPYYWGYYPRHYHYRNPLHINIYLSNINRCINRDHYYYYSNSWRSSNAYHMHGNISRNDYSVRYPDRSYTRRNVNVSNRYEMDRERNRDYVKSYERGVNSQVSSERRSTEVNRDNNQRTPVYGRESSTKYQESKVRTENPGRQSTSGRESTSINRSRENSRDYQPGSEVKSRQETGRISNDRDSRDSRQQQISKPKSTPQPKISQSNSNSKAKSSERITRNSGESRR